MLLYQSTGILQYSGTDRLVVSVDKEMAQYYRSLIPKWIPNNHPRYSPHITVVRAGVEKPKNFRMWGKYHGQEIVFYYRPLIFNDKVYFWLNIVCKPLETIREELGLSAVSRFTVPPSGHKKYFHCTIANRKF